MQYQQIPPLIRGYAQWICWRYEDKGRTKLDKVPYHPITNTKVDITQPSSWVAFDTAVNFSHKFDGIGFCFHITDPFAVIDIDNEADPQIQANQIQLVESLQTYSEVSPSGKGLHLIVLASTEKGHRNKLKGYELYSTGRFITFTGNVYQNLPIEDRQEIVDELAAECNQTTNITVDQANALEQPETYDDATIWQMAANASNGYKFQQLWNGDISEYHGDQSKADFAMIDILSFYTQCTTQVKRLFRLSGLGQRKKAQREDYVNTMIVKSRDNQHPVMSLEQMKAMQETLKAKVAEKQIPEKFVVKKRTEEQYLPGGSMSLPPGLTGQIADAVYKMSYKPVAEMSICAALGLMAGIAGRSYNVNGSGLNLYLLLLAKTGSGKEAINSGISRILKEVRTIYPDAEKYVGPGDLASGQALIKYIAGHDTGSFVSVFGEFGIKLKSLCDPHAFGPSLMLQKALLDLFSKSGSGQALRSTEYSGADQSVPTVYSPAFSMIGESTPSWFYDHVNADMIASGLLPRFAVVDYLGGRPTSNYQADSYVIPSETVTGLAGLMGQAATLNMSRTVLPVQFDKESYQLFINLDRRCDDYINGAGSEVTAEMWNRAHLKTIRIAALLAVGNNPYAPTIDIQCWRWAERFVCDTIERLVKRFHAAGVGKSAEDKVVYSIKHFLLRYLDKKPRNANSKIHESGAIAYPSFVDFSKSHPVFRDTRRGRTATLRSAIGMLQDERIIYKLAPSAIPTDGQGVPGEVWMINSSMLVEDLNLMESAI